MIMKAMFQTYKKLLKNISRLFHHLANANQKEALFPEFCTGAERRVLPKS